MTSQAAATMKRRNAQAQITRSGLSCLSASRPTIAAQIPAITAAVAGSAITGGHIGRNLQSCWRVYRQVRGDDDAIHGDRAVQTGCSARYLSPPTRPGTVHAGGADLRGKLDRSGVRPVLSADGLRRRAPSSGVGIELGRTL